MSSSVFKTYLAVRDYEIDMQGIVHHSVYINYLEHCRSEYIDTIGIDVHQYHTKGYDLVVANMELSYKLSLRPKDKFYVTANLQRVGRLRMLVEQEIKRQDDDALILTANVTVLCVDRKKDKACMPDFLAEKLAKLV